LVLFGIFSLAPILAISGVYYYSPYLPMVRGELDDPTFVLAFFPYLILMMPYLLILFIGYGILPPGSSPNFPLLSGLGFVFEFASLYMLSSAAVYLWNRKK